MKYQIRTIGFLTILFTTFALFSTGCGGGTTHSAKEDTKHVDSEEDLPERCTADSYDKICVKSAAYICDLGSGKWVVDSTSSCEDESSSASGKSSSSSESAVSSSSDSGPSSSSSVASSIFSFDDVNLDFLLDFGTFVKEADGDDGRNVWTGSHDSADEAYLQSLESALIAHEYEEYEEDSSWHLAKRNGDIVHNYAIKMTVEGSICTFTINRL